MKDNNARIFLDFWGQMRGGHALYFSTRRNDVTEAELETKLESTVYSNLCVLKKFNILKTFLWYLAFLPFPENDPFYILKEIRFS